MSVAKSFSSKNNTWSVLSSEFKISHFSFENKFILHCSFCKKRKTLMILKQ